MYKENLKKIVEEINVTQDNPELLKNDIEDMENNLLGTEDNYRKLLEVAGDAIFVADAETGIIIYVNRKGEELLGRNASEIIGLHQTKLHPDGSDKIYKNFFAEAVNKRETAPHLLYLCHRDGRNIPVESTSSVTDINGKKVIIGIFRDITERKSAEEILIRSRRELGIETEERTLELAKAIKFLQTEVELHRHAKNVIEQLRYRNELILNSAGEGICGLDSEQKVIFINPAGAKMLGWQVEEIIGQSLHTLIHHTKNDGTDCEADECPNLKTLKDGISYCRSDEVFWRKDGSSFPVAYISTPIIESEKITGVVITFRDITEQKRAEDEVLRQSARTAVLARVASRLNSQLDLNEVLHMVCKETANALNVDAAVVLLYDESHKVLSYAADFGLSSDFGKAMKPVPRSIFDRFAENKSIIAIPDVQAVSGLVNGELYNSMNCRTVIAARMENENKLIGLLYTTTIGEKKCFDEYEQALLKGLADEAALAITNAILFKDANNRLEQLKALHEIDKAITSCLDIDVMLNILLEQATLQLHVDAASIWLLDHDLQSLECAAVKGFRLTSIPTMKLKLGMGVAGQCALERKIVSINDLGSSKASVMPMLQKEQFVSSYAVPLISKGSVKGVLEVFHRSSIDDTPEWLAFFETLAEQAAIVIDNASLIEELQVSNSELSLAYDTTLVGWSHALDLRDRETEGHSRRVTEITVHLAEIMGISMEKMVHIRRGALLHDIGKMGVPDSILLKPDKLTDEEWKIMRKHPIYAYEILSPIAFLRPALDIPYCHHEKIDGTGYPRGLKGEQIPLPARIFAVVDIWDALRSDRPYRSAWEEDKVREYLRSIAGTHLDSIVVEKFLQMDFKVK